MLNHGASKEEIQSRVRNGYLERMELRLRKMRKLLADREWNALRIECIHLKNTAGGFGLTEIARLAAVTEAQIPAHATPSALPLPDAREAAAVLFSLLEQTIRSRKAV